MDQINLSEHYPILSIKDNIVLSNNGDIIMCYALELPEIFTLSKEDYQNLQDFWYRTIKYLPAKSFVHKQDIFISQNYSGDELPDSTFLQRATKAHFKERPYSSHLSLLFIGFGKKNSLNASGIQNPFKTIPGSKKLLEEFQDGNVFVSEVSKTIEFLNSSKYIKAHPIYEDEIDSLIQNYYNGFDSEKYVDTDMITKVRTKGQSYNAIGVGDKRVGVFAINDIKQFPDYVDTYKLDNDYSSKKFKIYKGASDDFGFKMSFDHIYNQVIYIDDHSEHKKNLENRKEHLVGAKGFGTDNKMAAEDLTEYLEQLSRDDSKKIVRGHSNIIYYAKSDAEFDEYTNIISTVYRTLDYKPHYPNKNSVQEIYLKSLFPYVSTLSNQNLFRTELEVALTLFLNITSYKSDDEGIVFSDRIFNIPIKRDVRDESKKRIKAWNFFIFAPTGEGKSVLANHIFRQLNEQGKKLVIFDIGGSFKKLSYLIPKEKSIFFSYEHGKPLGLNPFYLNDVSDLDIDKKNSLAEFIYSLWFPDKDIDNGDRTILIKLLDAYYLNVVRGFSFPNFYNFIKINSKSLLQQLGINDRFFDLESFLLMTETYVTGEYSFLFGETEDFSHRMEDKDIVIFEFEKANDNVILLSLLLQLGNEAVNKIILEDRSIDGVVFYDELAKFIKEKSIRNRVTHYYQTNRKHSASVGTALQTPDQLPEGPDTNAMIENSQVVYILHNEKGYEPIVKRFNLSEHQHNILKSITPNLKAKNPYTEFALIIGKFIWVMRLELSRESFYAYQTDGKEYNAIMKLFEEKKDMELAIKTFMAEQK
ncbi:TraG family conjugative transposon ATPase [Flagellimonas hymeniacidonis]|uniref:TraG family conjugative transposon ATPase n=1 Tax=Flagellimonas hymeniacidonis TaxID=2603628 RepID=A0A5C8V8K5_9FLAO|nr:TraG family conjugative transposon ATPase [Flagellimonas hymeniacidonis]TXN37706.1 TraG family conjugative transposon ATPase [Flagellimonas hymeniacidonis]